MRRGLALVLIIVVPALIAFYALVAIDIMEPFGIAVLTIVGIPVSGIGVSVGLAIQGAPYTQRSSSKTDTLASSRRFEAIVRRVAALGVVTGTLGILALLWIALAQYSGYGQTSRVASETMFMAIIAIALGVIYAIGGLAMSQNEKRLRTELVQRQN
jgi:hypothetical protein